MESNFERSPNARLILLILLGFCSMSFIQAQKTDRIFMKNGDHLTCDIKWMEFGKVKVKVDEMSSIYIEWDAIDSLWSNRIFEVHFEDGSLMEMSLEEKFHEHIQNNYENVVRLARIKDRFISRLEGDASLGFNYDKSSEILRIAIDADITHRSFKKSTVLEMGTVFTLDDDQERTNRRDSKIIQNWFAKNEVSYRAMIGYDQNTELGLKGRLLGGGGIGKDFLNDQTAWLFAGVGASGNIEWSTDSTIERKTNAEAVGIVEFKKFSYDFPEIDINSSLTIYPSFTQGGRIRMDWDTKLKIEIIDDFFVSLNFYYHYDSKPIDVLASKNDWGTSFSVGYSF